MFKSLYNAIIGCCRRKTKQTQTSETTRFQSHSNSEKLPETKATDDIFSDLTQYKQKYQTLYRIIEARLNALAKHDQVLTILPDANILSRLSTNKLENILAQRKNIYRDKTTKWQDFLKKQSPYFLKNLKNKLNSDDNNEIHNYLEEQCKENARLIKAKVNRINQQISRLDKIRSQRFQDKALKFLTIGLQKTFTYEIFSLTQALGTSRLLLFGGTVFALASSYWLGLATLGRLLILRLVTDRVNTYMRNEVFNDEWAVINTSAWKSTYGIRGFDVVIAAGQYALTPDPEQLIVTISAIMGSVVAETTICKLRPKTKTAEFFAYLGYLAGYIISKSRIDNGLNLQTQAISKLEYLQNLQIIENVKSTPKTTKFGLFFGRANMIDAEFFHHNRLLKYECALLPKSAGGEASCMLTAETFLLKPP